MAFCLIKPLAEKFKQMIKSGEIDIDRLIDMSSQERNQYFKNIFGEDRVSKEVNALFESKLLLKYQKTGLVNWAKQIAGMKPEIKNTLIDKIVKMKEILKPETEKVFLQDLVSKRLGADISIVEAKKIAEMSEKITNLENWKTDKERIAYGRAKIDLNEYINSLNPKKASLLTNIAGVPRSFMASLDLSAPLNQGWGMLSRKQFYTNLGSMLKAALNKDNYLDLQADIITRPNYKAAKKAGLRLTDLSEKLEMREEQFMSSLLDKVPGIAASQRAYTGFLNKLRIDVFDDLVKKAREVGEDIGIGSKVLEDIAKVVNNFTGGARVGKIEGAVPILNAAFFSPRKITSTLNILNPRNYIDPKISPTARKAAIRNLVGSLAITMTVLKLADVLGGDVIEIEENQTSSDFGKIKVGDTRLDLSGGNSSYITLVSRLLKQEVKSTATDIITPLGTKYGETSGFELTSNFVRNKLSPNASLLVDIITGANAIGEKRTILQSIKDRFKPMFINSVIELAESDTTGKFPLALISLFGAGLNTYSISEDWSQSDAKSMIEFKNNAGDDNFKKANDEYNEIIRKEIFNLRKTGEYNKLSEEDKLKQIQKIKKDNKNKILKEYNP